MSKASADNVELERDVTYVSTTEDEQAQTETDIEDTKSGRENRSSVGYTESTASPAGGASNPRSSIARHSLAFGRGSLAIPHQFSGSSPLASVKEEAE